MSSRGSPPLPTKLTDGHPLPHLDFYMDAEGPHLGAQACWQTSSTRLLNCSFNLTLSYLVYKPVRSLKVRLGNNRNGICGALCRAAGKKRAESSARSTHPKVADFQAQIQGSLQLAWPHENTAFHRAQGETAHENEGVLIPPPSLNRLERQLWFRFTVRSGGW